MIERELRSARRLLLHRAEEKRAEQQKLQRRLETERQARTRGRVMRGERGWPRVGVVMRTGRGVRSGSESKRRSLEKRHQSEPAVAMLSQSQSHAGGGSSSQH